MVELILLSTVLMGLLVIATFIAIARRGSKRKPPGTDEHDRYDRTVATLEEVVQTPVVWTISFIVLAVGVGVLAVVAVGDFGLSEAMSGTLLGAVYGLVGLLVAGFVFLGAYTATRERGLGNAQGVAVGSIALGMVFLLLITLQLVVGVVG